MNSGARIRRGSGTAFRLQAGATLTVIEPEGNQVAGLLAFNADDVDEVASSGRTFDYAESIRLTTGAVLFSNRSRKMLAIISDAVGCHDFLLTPRSVDAFNHFYPDKPAHRGCFRNLVEPLILFGIVADRAPAAFGCFMNVPLDTSTCKLSVEPPVSNPGEYFAFRAEIDFLIGLTACSAYASNGGSLRPNEYRIE